MFNEIITVLNVNNDTQKLERRNWLPDTPSFTIWSTPETTSSNSRSDTTDPWSINESDNQFQQRKQHCTLYQTRYSPRNIENDCTFYEYTMPYKIKDTMDS